MEQALAEFVIGKNWLLSSVKELLLGKDIDNTLKQYDLINVPGLPRLNDSQLLAIEGMFKQSVSLTQVRAFPLFF